MKIRTKTRKTGQSLLETLAGMFLVIPVLMFALNVQTAILTSQVNHQLAKKAARAAANKTSHNEARAAALKSVISQKKSPIILAVQLKDIDYVPRQSVSVKTEMKVKLPAPMIGLASDLTFLAHATVPVVAAPAAL